MIAKHKVEEQVLAAIRGIALTRATGPAVPDPITDSASFEARGRRREVMASLAQVEQDRRKWVDAFEAGESIDLGAARRIRELAKAERKLREELPRLAGVMKPSSRTASNVQTPQYLRDLPRVMQNADENQLRDIIHTFVRRVVIVPTQERSKGNRVKQIQIELFPL